MKMITLLVGLIFVNNSYARSSGPTGFGMEIDRESLGVVANGAIAEGPGGYGSLGYHESFGAGGSGRIMSDRTFDIGEFDGMRALELPTSFDGNIGGRF